MSSQLRKFMYKQRKSLSIKERQYFAWRASLYLPKLLPYLPKHGSIGLYLDDFGELPTAPIFKFCQKHQFTPFLPITHADRALTFAPVFSDLHRIPLKRHALGMKEPIAKNTVTADKLEVIICPLVAVDQFGHRLGMGGGFYDRTFAKSPKTLKVGYCYHFQVFDKLIVNPWDKSVDMVITDKGILRF